AWLEALPFGVGEAVAHTVEGASDRAQVRFPDPCPAWADCSDPEVIEQRRRAATVPGTARAIWARRSTSPARGAGTRFVGIQVPVELLAVEAAREEIAGVAARCPAAQVTTASAATLVEAVAGRGPRDQQHRAGRRPSLQGSLGIGCLREGEGG